MTPEDPRRFLRNLLDTAIAAAEPQACTRQELARLDLSPARALIVLGAGKSAAAMAAAVEASWKGEVRGLVVTRYGHGVPTHAIEVAEAAHPVPDAAGQDAAARLLRLAEDAGPDDTVLFLLSGGASSLLALPAAGLTLQHKQTVTRRLLDAGATIQEVNTVRKHLSAIKGGRLAAAAAPARLITLAISDVVGDDPSVIGSGPTVPDPTTSDDALAVLARYDVILPDPVAEHLQAGGSESPSPGDPVFEQTEYRILARAHDALGAAVAAAREAGVHPVLHNASAEGEARVLARQHAHHVATRLAQDILPLPWLLLTGGEATVTVRGNGRGGPNTEYALALALALADAPDLGASVWALAADTDGADGASDAAGAWVTPDTLDRARAQGLDAAAALDDNDSAGFFEALGDLTVTGPTLTNVNDFRAILVTDAGPAGGRAATP